LTATALLVSPHPDDEVLGAGAAAIALRRRGWRVINLVCGLGRPEDHSRRRREVQAAARVLDIETQFTEPLAMSSDDDLDAAQAKVTALVAEELESREPQIIIAPAVHDGHHAHELCGRAVRDAVQLTCVSRTVWWWRLWGQGGPPTLVIDCTDAMSVLRAALAEHAGEVDRNRYLELLDADATADAIRASEQLFGFGRPGLTTNRARVFCETVWDQGQWRFGEPRVLGSPTLVEPSCVSARVWLWSDSPITSRTPAYP
jgi:LmbE family N-acetylglucosaminyl deacetylase